MRLSIPTWLQGNLLGAWTLMFWYMVQGKLRQREEASSVQLNNMEMDMFHEGMPSVSFSLGRCNGD